jgi:hypothetical protein
MRDKNDGEIDRRLITKVSDTMHALITAQRLVQYMFCDVEYFATQNSPA